MNITPDPRDEERKLPANTMLYRIELRCAQAWAEALYITQNFMEDGASLEENVKAFDEMLSWKRAWIHIRALRLGHTIQFDYVGNLWRSVAPGVAVKP